MMDCPHCKKELPTDEILGIMYRWYKKQIKKMENDDTDIYDNEHYELMRQFCKDYEAEHYGNPSDYASATIECPNCKNTTEIIHNGMEHFCWICLHYWHDEGWKKNKPQEGE